MRLDREARRDRLEGGVGIDLGGVEVQLLPPDETRLAALLDDRLEEAAEDRQAVALPDPGQARVVRQLLVQVIPQVPPDAQPIGSYPDQLPLGADPFEEHHELELEEDPRIDRRSPALL